MATKRTSGTAIAALTLEITDRTGKSVQLLPAGHFKARDGRPASIAACKEWMCGPDQAQSMVTAATSQHNPLVIDYEHQTLNAERNGQPAPAAGWFKTMEWRAGEGLFATDVDWTPAAAKAIADGEYRYISPVFEFSPVTGEVRRMVMAALTNNPGLDGMRPVALSHTLHPEEEPPMNKLLEALLKALGLNGDANEDQALAAMTSHFTKAKTDAEQVVALSAQVVAVGTPDPAKYVPVSVLTELQGHVAALTSQVAGREVDEVVRAALSAGKLLPSLESWARDLGKKDLAALKTYVEAAPKIAALTSTQTGGRAPVGDQTTVATDATLLAVCKMFGNTTADVLKTQQGDAQ